MWERKNWTVPLCEESSLAGRPPCRRVGWLVLQISGSVSWKVGLLTNQSTKPGFAGGPVAWKVSLLTNQSTAPGFTGGPGRRHRPRRLPLDSLSALDTIAWGTGHETRRGRDTQETFRP